MFNDILSSQIEAMNDFQKENKITDKCITNVSYMLDTLKPFRPNVKAVPIIALVKDADCDENDLNVIHGHVVLEIDDMLIDPSYYVVSMEKKQYFLTLEAYKDFVKSRGIREHIEHEQIAVEFERFTKIAEQMNNGTCDILDEEYYKKQEDYVEERFKELGII